jgi:5'(3')-deoxyribonucleotidase
MTRIALDFDNVLADTMNLWIKYYNNIYKKSLTKSDITKWEFWVDLGIPETEAFKIFDKVWSNLSNLPLLEKNANIIIKELATIAEIDIVTAVKAKIKPWLDWKGIIYNDIIYGYKKTQLDYSIFIDDSPSLAEELANEKICLLYNQPWNQNISKKTKKIIRIRSLDDALRYVREMVLKN